MRLTSPDIDSLLECEIVAAGVAPGAAAAVGVETSAGWAFLEGCAGMRSALRPDPITPASLFDLASITKPIFAVVLARLADTGALAFAEPLEALLPAARGSQSGKTPLEWHLAHRAGLVAHREFFRAAAADGRVDREAVLREAADGLRPECTGPLPDEGFPALYSDLGYLLLGAAVEARTGTELDVLVQRELDTLGVAEIGSARQLAARIFDFPERVVPTETVPYRGGEVVGRVHDDNAWAFSGEGCTGHAGCFGSARELARFGSRLLGPDGVASPAASECLLRRRTGASLRAGFDGRSDTGSSIGERMSVETFGHLGFTGTSLWCDPVHRIVVALLTNRVSPDRSNLRIRAARPRVHDALFDAALKWVGPGGRGLVVGPGTSAESELDPLLARPGIRGRM